MAVGFFGEFAAPRGPFEVAFLNQKGFVDLFDGARFFADGGGNGVQPHGAALEFVADAGQNSVVHFVQSVMVHLKGIQSSRRNLNIDDTPPLDLCEVPCSS